MDAQKLSTAVAYAAERGAQDGAAAASWYFDGNTADATYRAVLAGIAEGDPAVLDVFPAADLSGQWVDVVNGPTLAADAADAADMDDPATDDDMDALLNAVCDAYETAYATAAHDAIETAARAALS